MREKLEQVYKQYRQGLFSLALSITRNTPEAEDAIHDAFARLAKRNHPPQGDVVPYVFAAVRNASLDLLRKRSRQPDATHTIIAAPCDTAPSSQEHILHRERSHLLREAVESLPDAQKQTVVMKAFAGLTFQQIAETLGEPLSTISSRYQRALKDLRRSLEEVLV